MAETEIVVNTINLRKQFKSRIVVDEVNLQIESGDIYGLIGSNGSGKSVILKILATILKPSAGSVRIFDQDILKKPQKIRGFIGYMPDNLELSGQNDSYDELRVWEYLDFFAGAYKISKKDRINTVNDILELMDLSSSRDCQVRELSLGMKKRLGIARTLIHDPSLLILDEPICMLDLKARVEIKEIIKELSNMGKTIIMASNMLSDLSSICNKVGIIKNGRILYSGSIDNILSQLGKSLTIEIGIGDNMESAKRILQNHVDIGDIDVKGNIINAQYNGNREDIHKILAILIDEQTKVFSFQEKNIVLDDVFFKTHM